MQLSTDSHTATEMRRATGRPEKGADARPLIRTCDNLGRTGNA